MTPNFTITVNETEQDIKMSFGLLNVLCRTVGDIDGALLLDMDQDSREAVLIELLSDRTDKGKIDKPFDLMTAELEQTEVSALLDWAGEHLMDFFLGALEKTKAKQVKHQERIAALMPT